MERFILDSILCKNCRSKANKINEMRFAPTIYRIFKCENPDCERPITVQAQDYEDSGNIPIELRSYKSEEEFDNSFESIKL